MITVSDFLYFIRHTAWDGDNPNKVWMPNGYEAGANHYGYILGAKGQLYTPELALKWNIERGIEIMPWWYGHYITDCSGMVFNAGRSKDPTFPLRSSYGYRNDCTKRGAISSIPNIPGLMVWKLGHIGVYDGDGWVIESRGRYYGVVRTPLSSQKWTEWGYLKNVQYEETVEWPVANYPTVRYGSNDAKKNYILKAGDPNGYIYVFMLQEHLNKASYGLTTDGVFGSRTLSAVKDFQKKSGLVVDGIVGIKTWTKLEGLG